MSETSIKAAIEALLFSSDKPVLLEQLKHALNGLETSEIRKSLEELKVEMENAKRGLRINEVAGGFQMVADANFAPFLKKLHKDRRTEKLSRPALETLAIIAYKQPVTKAEIEVLRNVNVDGLLDNLVEKDLVRIAGRKKAPGSPYVFGTTRKFLEYFGLRSLDELPKMEDFSKIADTGKELVNEPQGTA